MPKDPVLWPTRAGEQCRSHLSTECNFIHDVLELLARRRYGQVLREVVVESSIHSEILQLPEGLRTADFFSYHIFYMQRM